MYPAVTLGDLDPQTTEIREVVTHRTAPLSRERRRVRSALARAAYTAVRLVAITFAISSPDNFRESDPDGLRTARCPAKFVETPEPHRAKQPHSNRLAATSNCFRGPHEFEKGLLDRVFSRRPLSQHSERERGEIIGGRFIDGRERSVGPQPDAVGILIECMIGPLLHTG
jgi:hypothetical protein